MGCGCLELLSNFFTNSGYELCPQALGGLLGTAGRARRKSVGAERSKSNRMPAMEIEPFRVVTQPGTRDGLHVLTLRGALTSTSSPAFTEAVIGVAAPRLIVDLTGVPTVDSVAIGALVRAFVSCHKSGRKLALVGMNHRVQNVLHITGIAPLFDSYETVAQAERALG